MNLEAYDRFVAAASPIGRRIVFVAGGILVLDLAAMVTLRHMERRPLFFKGIGVKGECKRTVLGRAFAAREIAW